MRIRKQKPFARGAGILLPISSLPAPYGIGTFGKEAYAFVDFLKEAKQKYWQVLPLGPTSYGDSPYQSFSAFAGNPYFIDLDTLIKEGLLTEADVDRDWGDDPANVDYEKIYNNRFIVLHKAFDAFVPDESYDRFVSENAEWLHEYASYMAIKAQFDNHSWQEWDEDIRFREPEAVKKYETELKDEIAFWKFTQYEFYKQWNALKAYANDAGITIIGDIPIYVALDSADVWCHPDQFQLDERLRPTRVAGVPPDLFSATGQLWGNPLYRWEDMKKDGFTWWRKRIAASAKLYDVIRIDHFVGIAHYYSIPAGDKTAENGYWVDGPCEDFLAAVSETVDNKKIIAEDLGIVIPKVYQMLDKFGYPGMAVLQFGFDSGSSNKYLPHNHKKNLIVYGGTHDNQTMIGYLHQAKRGVLKFARDYLNVKTNKQLPDAIIRAGFASVANTVIFPMQDYLHLGDTARINTPSTLGINWMWRLTPGQIPADMADHIAALTELFGRN